MTTYEEWAEAFGSGDSDFNKSNEDHARILAGYVSPNAPSSIRTGLEALSQCGDPAAERIAREGLKKQKFYDSSMDFLPSGNL